MPDNIQVDPSQDLLTPIFNTAEIMENVGDDAEIAQVIVDAFLEDMPIQIEILENALENDDQELSHRQSHSLKGAGGDAGTKRFSEIAWEMEKAAKAGELGIVREKFVGLKAEFQLLIPVMKNVCWENASE